MFQSVDIYLGIFLIGSGLGIALLNLRRVLRGRGKFSHVLLSQNIILICIGLAFLCRAVYALEPANLNMEEFNTRTLKPSHTEKIPCGFSALLLGYGPLVTSLVNSFLSLVIDNYMHYQNVKEEKSSDSVQDLREDSRSQNTNLNTFMTFVKSNYTYITIFLQWILPIVTTLMLYPMNVHQVSLNEMRNFNDNCIALLDLTNGDCEANYTLPIHKYISTPNISQVLDLGFNKNTTDKIDVVLKNVLNILNTYNNNSDFNYAQTKSARIPKADDCMRICVINNKNILLYMVIISFVCFFAPVTISLIILTKIHTMNVKKGAVKNYVTQDIVYNVLFWSPVMFDTFLSLILCSFSMQGTRTSIFNIVANLYQAVKNFMNTKHFNDNIIVPA